MYTKTIWVNRDPNTPINANNLNNMEDGIEILHKLYDWRVISANDGTQTLLEIGESVLLNVQDSTADLVLPINPNSGDTIRIADGGQDFSLRTAYVDGNGEAIMGVGTRLELVGKFDSVELVYTPGAYGWLVTSRN